MTTQARIAKLLERVKDNADQAEKARRLVDGFSLGVKEIFGRKLSPTARAREICRRRDLLYAELCELVDPLGLGDPPKADSTDDSSP